LGGLKKTTQFIGHTAKPQAPIWIFPKHQLRVSSVQLRRSVGTWHSYQKKIPHISTSHYTISPHT